MKPIHVLHVVEATTAGVGRHVYHLALEMQRAGLEVTVACPQVREGAWKDVAFVERLESARVPVAIVPMRRSIHPLADWRALTGLVRLIRHRQVDVVHAHSSKAGVLGRLAARWARVPAVVYTPNAFAFLGARHGWTRWLYRAIERWLGHHASDMIICVSQSEISLARQNAIASPQQLVLVENAIDPSHFSVPVDPAAARSRLGLDATRPVVGFIGRLTAQKGPDIFVRAARQVLDSGGDAQFVLVGEGELEDALREMVRANRLDGRVVLAGYQAEIAEVLAALDIFVLPSLYEGLPYTLMEAMATGLPVIATRVGGNCDLVRDGENGLLVPPRDVDTLAAQLVHLLCEPDERERLGMMALAAARSRPTLEQRTRQVIALYARLLESQEVET